MGTYKARIVAEVSFVVEVEAEDAFDAIYVAERAVRKMQQEDFAARVTSGTVRSAVVSDTYAKRKKR